MKRLAALGCAAAFLVGAAASASAAKKKKDDTPVAPAEPKSSILSNQSAVKGPKTRQGPAKYNDNQLSPAERDSKADQKRDEEIEELEKLIPTQSGATKADLLFQLSELWWEKSKFVYFTEMATYEQAMEAYMEQAAKGTKGLSEPKVSTRKSDLYRQQAIDLYNKILTDYPQYPRKDEVLFNLAYNMYDLGKKKEAVARYWELIRQYPDSKFVPDSYVQLGEHFFNSNDLERARKAYEKALAFNIPQIYAFALYKLAWCDYNANAFDEALGKFRKVVDYQENAIKGSGAKGERQDKIQLKNEALNDMVLSFSKLNQVDEAKAYYDQHANKKRSHRYMAKLATVYFEAGQWDASIKTYRLILEDDPNDQDAPSYQANIVKAFANQGPGKRNFVHDELKKLVDAYKPSSQWAQANSHNKVALANAYELSEGSMRELVTEYHSEAQRTKVAATYRLARDIYKEYLADFPESDNAYTLRFYYAEILWALEQWAEAADQYQLVVDKDAKGVYAKSAAFAEILSYNKLLDIEEGRLKQRELTGNEKVEETKKKGTVEKTTKRLETAKSNTTEEPLTKWEQKLVSSGDNYVRLFPGTTDEPNILYKAAVIYYDHYHYVEAARRFGDVITKYPTDKNATYAATLTLEALQVKSEWEALNKLARLFAKNKLLNKPGTEFAKDLQKKIEYSQFQYDLLIYQKKDYEKAATLFAEFVKEFPKSQYSPTALYNSVVMFQNASKLDLAIPEGEKLLREYPQSELVREVSYKVATFYEQTADYPKAAEAYEGYFNKYGKPEKPGKGQARTPKPAVAAATPAKPAADAEKLLEATANSLYNAALWNEALGHHDKAITLYDEYTRVFRDRKDVPEVAFTIGLIQERQKDWKAAIKTFENYGKTYNKDITPGQGFFARYKQMTDLRKTGAPADEKVAAKMAEDLLKVYPKLPDGDRKNDLYVRGYAELRFHDLDPAWTRYKAIKFDNPNRLKAALDIKVKALAELEKDYTSVVGIRAGDWGVAAVTRIGLAYLDLAKNFTDSPDPKNLPPDLLDQYRAELENRALPLEDKGIEGIEKGLQKSSELNVYNDFVIQAQEQENKFRPGTFLEIHSLPYQGSEFYAIAPIETQPSTPSQPSPVPVTGTAGAGAGSGE